MPLLVVAGSCVCVWKNISLRFNFTDIMFKQVERERDQLARKVLSLAEIAAGLKGRATPLLLEAASTSFLL